MYDYNGNVSREFVTEILECFKTYKADKEPVMQRIRDNERFYASCYEPVSPELKQSLHTNTPLIFSAIENARADATDSYPSPNILEREPQGTAAARMLSRIVPAQLEISEFKRTYKDNMRSKLKYGTAVYGVFYNEDTGDIEIKSVALSDIYVDMHIQDIQESRFLFINAAVENDVLIERYPELDSLFTGDTVIETFSENCILKNRSPVLDCYYKKPDGTVHMIKLCRDTVLMATEDLKGYENGIYSHGMYPVVFDTLYPVENCPFGFGMLDIGKTTQITIDKLDAAITENIMCGAKPRYLAKRNGGIDEEEFKDLSRNIVHYEGDADSIKPVDTAGISEYFLAHRERKKEELKEILANRDFQQGATSGGVTAASAIEALRETGEKRTRSIVNDTYDTYKKIIYMMLELMREFFSNKHVYRVTDDWGQKTFEEFSGSDMFFEGRRLQFDIEVVPQRESPFSRESGNKTIVEFWDKGLFLPENYSSAIIALKNMNFDGKENLLADLKNKAYERGTLNV